ncbi:MAG TPA: isochorismatase family cysteine hydrolase [Acidimicrobiales bacterium]|nr:isochorismatase family cysteine hydrolase [Acidimicrobiales bacterium]
MLTGLVVVDMLNDFVDGVLANPAAKEIVGPIAALIARARTSQDWLVVYANDAHRPADPELRIYPPHAMAGTAGAAVVDELRPAPGDLVVEKRYYSAFTETALDDLLRTRGVARLVVVGQHTDCCVRHTSYDAFVHTFELAVCPDATTVFEPGSNEPVAARQQRALEYLHSYYRARLVPSTSVA